MDWPFGAGAARRGFDRIVRKVRRRRETDPWATERCETPHGVFFIPRLRTDVIANTIRKGDIFEPQIVRAAERYVRPGTCVLDLGANFGQMSLVFARMVGNSGRVIAIEADEYIHGLLQKNIEANGKANVRAILGAVYDQPGKRLFYPVPDFRRFGAFGSYGIDPKASAGREGNESHHRRARHQDAYQLHEGRHPGERPLRVARSARNHHEESDADRL